MSSITFTLVQTHLHWETKAANLIMLHDKIMSISHKTQVVILPEMFTTGFSMQPGLFAEEMEGETVQWMKKIAAEKKIILTGSAIIKEMGCYYNRLLWVLPNRQVGYYNKRHLFAFAGENQHYTAGNKRLVASVNGWRINLQVCYDLRFPVWARQQPLHSDDEAPAPEYDILVYVANWPEKRSHAWRTLLQARAIENQCFVIGVNRVGNDGKNIYHSGNSMVVSPLGDILYEKQHEEDIYTITLQREQLEEVRKTFPFWKDSDKFKISHE